MFSQLSGNLFLAVLWLLLSNGYTFGNFALGYLFGLLVIYLLCRKNGRRFYLFKLLSGIKLFAVFFKEIILSNITVLKYLFLRKDISPAIICYETALSDPLAITLLANMITLTPGTVTIEVSADNRFLYIHALAGGEPKTFCSDIRRKFERNIAEVMR